MTTDARPDESAPPPTLPLAAIAALVCAAYYFGAQLGFSLAVPPLTTSVLWPPNAILTATLLITPERRWWIYLLAAFPAHVFIQVQAGFPAPLILGLFATNCSEALIAAYGVRRLSGPGPVRFDSLSRVGSFVLAAVLVAPFASSFLDAGVVWFLRGEPYWLVWRTRFFSNVVTELALVPSIVVAVTGEMRWLARAPFARRAEAALLGLGLLLVAMGSLAHAPEQAWARSRHLTMAFSMPFLPPLLLFFLTWAAVRFGPGGASFGLLGTALLAIRAAASGRGPFTAATPAEGVLGIQVFFVEAGIPLMFLAGVIEERRRASVALAARLRVEELLSRLSSAFVHLPVQEIDQAITTWLARLGETLALDRIVLRLFSEDGRGLVAAHSYRAPGAEATPAILPCEDYPWIVGRLRREEHVIIARVTDLPEEATRDRESLRHPGINAGLTLPLVASGRVIGCLAFRSVEPERPWPEDLVRQLQLGAEVLANALARKQTEQALRASESMKSAILGSLSSRVAMLDSGGRVMTLNERWERFREEDASSPEAGASVGAVYPEAYRRAALDGVPGAKEAQVGIEAVLRGVSSGFSLEYPRMGGGAERWFAMSVVPLKRPEGGAVVSHTEVTERKRAELEAQRSRQELAHFTRVSTMGELTASMAHELNQPLTGILANAQAARRFLDAPEPDLAELRAILVDIIEDDRRAADVIQRLRDLLRKGPAQVARLDINTVVRDVVRLVGSDALIRDVAIGLDLDPRPPLVVGDRVQLQQVVLNLLVNAMEAVSEGANGDRALLVRTEGTASGGVAVSVRDGGPGLRPGSEETIFDPFYSTKSGGMGMGLSIARSIVSAHGGVIWARNNPVRGATLQFTLPAAREAAREAAG